MYAIKNANSSPTPSPNSTPRPRECTLRANMPIKTPASSPLNVEPSTMPISCGRTAGVNHEVSPSKIPRMPPKISPYVTLFIQFLPSACIFQPSPFYYPRIGIPLTPKPENQQRAQRKVCQHQHNRQAIPC